MSPSATTQRFRALTLAVGLGLAATSSVVLAPAPALAQQDVTQRLEALRVQAVEDYENLMVEDAERKLEDAIAIARRQNIINPTVARLHLMLGIVRFAATQDAAMTEDAFVTAIEIDAASEIDAVYNTPELTGIMDKARRRARNRRPVETPVAATATAPTAFEHTPVKSAQAQQPLRLFVSVPASMPVGRILVHHRRFGETDYAQTDMQPDGNTAFRVDLAPRDVRTSQLEYYIQAVDRAGNLLGESGRPNSPHRMVVLGSSDAPVADVAPPSTLQRPPAGDTPPVEAFAPEAFRPEFYAFLGAGSGVGFLVGGEPTANPTQSVSPGLAPAFGHALLDLGMVMTPRTSLGLYWRYQFSPGQDFSALPETYLSGGSGFWDSRKECMGLGLPGDCMLGLKYRYLFADSGPKFYSSAGAGVGRVRNWLQLRQATSSSRPDFNCFGKETYRDVNSNQEFCYVRDTVRTGWFHAGAGAGMFYPVSANLDLAVDSYLMVLLPETSFNLDLNLGLRLRL